MTRAIIAGRAGFIGDNPVKFLFAECCHVQATMG